MISSRFCHDVAKIPRFQIRCTKLTNVRFPYGNVWESISTFSQVGRLSPYRRHKSALICCVSGKEKGRQTEADPSLSAHLLWQFALVQNLASMASLVPLLEQVPGGHVTLVQTPPEQLPIPFIALAHASAVRIGEKLKSAIEAIPAFINFI